MRVRMIVVAFVVLAMASGASWAQSLAAGGEMSEHALHTMTAEAVATAKGDATKTLDAFDKAAKARWGDFSRDAVVLRYSPAIIVALFSPYWSYRHDLGERLRKMESIDNIPLRAIRSAFLDRLLTRANKCLDLAA